MIQLEAKIEPQNVRYPWMSALGALATSVYLYVYTQPDLIAFYHIPHYVLQQPIQYAVIGLFFVLLIVDARIFHRKLQKQQQDASKLDNQVNELLIAKKQLQQKAHTFAGHADKLKLFISDRLLEYIEYDEKFLHFKSIASEVRHNGVICFDKVQTALQHAIYHSDTKDNDKYQDALNSMIYLWDLLELSTTDNLALHISNQLCECEEHYYQALLQDDVLSNDLSSPTFAAHSAIAKAINPLMEEPVNLNIDSAVTDTHSEQLLIIQDDTFWIRIEKTKQLLGNENHIILLLENLINNAAFYASKRSYGHKHARIAVQLLDYHSNIRYSIYNHGPHINDEDKGQIFQLGYSTRRVREHNGKGLGLYFVNEIVKGYEGKISFENIYNREAIYSIRIAFADNTVITDVIETQLNNDKPECKRSTEDTLSTSIEWASKEKVASIEVSTQTTRETFSFTTGNEARELFLDPEDASVPRWSVEITQRKRSNKVIFTALDINGVCFYVDLPSAESRLDYSDTFDEFGHSGEQDLASLRENFMDPTALDG